MATWHQHQRKAVKLAHPTEWTVVTDPPNDLRTLCSWTTEAAAHAYIERLRQHHPREAAHSYVLPPDNHKPETPLERAERELRILAERRAKKQRDA